MVAASHPGWRPGPTTAPGGGADLSRGNTVRSAALGPVRGRGAGVSGTRDRGHPGRARAREPGGGAGSGCHRGVAGGGVRRLPGRAARVAGAAPSHGCQRGQGRAGGAAQPRLIA